MLDLSMTVLDFPKDPLLVPGVDHCSNECNSKLDIFPSLFKNGFNRGLNEDCKINSVYVSFYLNTKVRCI